jgi:hypothetical protein
VGIFTVTLAIVFVGVMTAMLPMVFGPPPEVIKTEHERWRRWRSVAMLAPAAVLLLAGFTLGAYQPLGVRDALAQAAQTLVPLDDSLHASAGTQWTEADR